MKLKSLKSRLIWFHHLDKNFVDRFLAIIASLEVLVESRREYLWWPSSRRNWRVRSRSESTCFLMASDFFRINSWKIYFFRASDYLAIYCCFTKINLKNEYARSNFAFQAFKKLILRTQNKNNFWTEIVNLFWDNPLFVL